MRDKIYILLGVIGILGCILSVFVFKVSGSESGESISECTPYNVNVKRGKDENSVRISWINIEKCSGYILYGSDMKDLSMVSVDLENEIQSKIHAVEINSLVSTKTYYFTIVSENVSYGKEGLPLQFSISSL